MASPKSRDYMVTINEGAECFDNALEIVKEMNVVLYAFIVHDKDKEILDDGSVVDKKLHKHIVIELKNPITFQSMQNHFKGAHIDLLKYKKAAYQYLIHNRPNAKEKYQYPVEDILSNNLSSVKRALEAEEGLRLFNEREFLRYIAEGITSPYQFTKAFGLNVYKQYWRPYKEMLDEINVDPVMKRDLEEMKAILEKELDDDLPF